MNFTAQIPVFSRVSTLEVVLFTKHLAIMVKSGVPLTESLVTLRDQTGSARFRMIIADVIGLVENGQTLAKALSHYPQVFDPVYVSLIEIGEESGKLEGNLDYLATLMRKNYDFNKKVQGALLYPGIVLSGTFIIGTGIALFVLPQLVDLFKSLEVDLPIQTKILLFFAQTMKDYGIFIFSFLFAFLISMSILIQTPHIKPLWHNFLLRTPIFGNLIKNIQLSLLCRNLGIMLQSGLTLNTSLDIQYSGTKNLVFKQYIDRFNKAVVRGKKLSSEMNSKDFHFMPAIVSKMVEVGEKTGKLEESLLYLGDFFDDEVDTITRNLSSTLEPILLIVIGLIVGFVASAIFTPIYQLTGSIRR